MKKQPLIIAFIACLSLSACHTTYDIPAKATSFDRLKPPFDIAQRRARMGVSQTDKITMRCADIAPDGTLSLELKRGSKALHYHVISIQALVLIAELGNHNGLDLYGANDSALKRLIKHTMAGLADSGFFTEKTGKTQSWIGKLNGAKLAWMEPYYDAFAIPRSHPG